MLAGVVGNIGAGRVSKYPPAGRAAMSYASAAKACYCDACADNRWVIALSHREAYEAALQRGRGQRVLHMALREIGR